MAWEHDFLIWMQSLHSSFMDGVMAFLSNINHQGLLCIALGIILLFLRKTRRTGIQVLLSIAIAYLIANVVIKNIVARERPYEAFADILPAISLPHDASFPSGHTVSAFAAATAVFLNNKKLGIVALLIAALIAFSRLYNLVHFPTDVLAGAAIGVIVAVLVHFVVYPLLKKVLKNLLP